MGRIRTMVMQAQAIVPTTQGAETVWLCKASFCTVETEPLGYFRYTRKLVYETWKRSTKVEGMHFTGSRGHALLVAHLGQ